MATTKIPNTTIIPNITTHNEAKNTETMTILTSTKDTTQKEIITKKIEVTKHITEAGRQYLISKI